MGQSVSLELACILSAPLRRIIAAVEALKLRNALGRQDAAQLIVL